MDNKHLFIRFSVPLALFALLLVPAMATGEDDKPPASRVAVTVELPSKLSSFDDAALIAILYEFDPRLADAAATEIDRVVVRHLGHQQGIEQTLRFSIGDKLGAPLADRRYYVSCRIYEDLGEKTFKQGKQVHYCHNEHDRLPGTVYDQQNGRKLTFTAR